MIVNPILQVTFDLATPLVYEGLLGLDSRLEPQPRLAERWRRSQDGRTLTFELRKDVMARRQGVQADDVLYTIERIRNPQCTAASVPTSRPSRR